LSTPPGRNPAMRQPPAWRRRSPSRIRPVPAGHRQPHRHGNVMRAHLLLEWYHAVPVRALTWGAGVASTSEVERRLDTTTATTITAAATSAIPTRIANAFGNAEIVTIAGAINTETRFMTLISGLMAGPAVSLNGSPTVSPITVAACESEPLPPWLPSSTSFLALSQAPPELARKIAIRVPVMIAPARYEPSGA